MPTEPEVPPQRIDGRKVGLSTQGYPLRKIVERVNGIHLLSCGHRLPKPAEATDYDLRKSRRCVECGPKKARANVNGYVPASALAEVWEKAIKTAHCSLNAGSAGSADFVSGYANGVLSGAEQVIRALEAARDAALSVGKVADDAGGKADG